ncbi:ligase-associated DNA damage response endonuclease PdeM [Maribacter sp. 2210JD10-5]|uniref:ligase-associated DNA damage response endonuclease PdeM n=1 Tax=Maribacter sp. 2210JD10-5 TaxID=3386272 RepID=UPI0039BC5B59
MTESIYIKNQEFILHCSGALFWVKPGMLLISDVHLGKVSHFRKFGAAVPQNAVRQNFDSLTSAIQNFDPGTVVFMGDLFHSSLNLEWDIFSEWTKTISSKIILVSGNHDIISPLKYEDLGILVTQEIVQDGFLLTHHPEEKEGFFNFSGHVHPAIRLTGLGRQSVRLPCFYKTEQQLIMPAFGEFTGTFTVEPTTDSEIYAILGDTVLKVNISEKKKRGRSK